MSLSHYCSLSSENQLVKYLIIYFILARQTDKKKKQILLLKTLNNHFSFPNLSFNYSWKFFFLSIKAENHKYEGQSQIQHFSDDHYYSISCSNNIFNTQKKIHQFRREFRIHDFVMSMKFMIIKSLFNISSPHFKLSVEQYKLNSKKKIKFWTIKRQMSTKWALKLNWNHESLLFTRESRAVEKWTKGIN